MIQRLVMDDFGKFRGRSFDFGPVTLITGPNEAGKTTIFDAVFDSLCAPKRNIDMGKRLYARYGKDRQARLEFRGQEISIPVSDFLNLFAIRAGDLSLEIDSNSQWMNRVKASLFSGGIDPGEAAERLRYQLTTRARGSLLKEETDLKAEIDGLLQRLDQDRAERDACLREEERVAEMDRQRQADGEKAHVLSQKVAGLEKILREQRILKEMRSLRQLASRPGEKRKQEAELSTLRPFSREGLDALRGTEERLKHLGAEKEKARASLEAAEETYRRSLAEKARAEEEKDKRERTRILADLLKPGIGDREKLVARKTSLTPRPLFLTAAILSLAAGISSYFLLSSTYALAGLALGAGIFVAAGSLSFRREIREDSRPFDEALAAAGQRWRTETGESWEGLGYEAILVNLDRSAERAAAAEEAFRTSRNAAASAERRVAELRTAFRRADEGHQDALRQSRSLLDSSGAADLADYAQSLARKKEQEKRLAEINGELLQAREKYGAATDEELESLLSRKAEELAPGAAEREMPDSQLRLTEGQLREAKGQLEKLQLQERSALGDYSLKLGSVRERFRGLPEKIAQTERQLALMEERLREIAREKKAIETARSIFASLAEDSDILLRELSGEIARIFSRFTGDERDIGLGAFSLKTATIQDAEGGFREGESLSTGTRDAFLLAARLALAQKSLAPGERSLVVLDEAFIALDRPRTARALEVLKEFHRETDWQILILSKDEVLVGQAREVFGELLLVYRL